MILDDEVGEKINRVVAAVAIVVFGSIIALMIGWKLETRLVELEQKVEFLMGKKLSDTDKMPFGHFKDQELGEIPDWYWLWFLKQTWSNKHPDLVTYAKACEEDYDDDD